MEELNRRKAVVYTHPFRNDCCRNLVPDVFEPLDRAGDGHHAHDREPAVQRLGGAIPRRQVDLLARRRHGAVPDAAVHLLFRRAQGPTATASERPRLLSGAVLLRHGQCHDHPSSLASLTKLVAPTQIVFGTDFPFLTAKATAAGLREVGLFSAAELQAIERGNAAGLMARYKI